MIHSSLTAALDSSEPNFEVLEDYLTGLVEKLKKGLETVLKPFLDQELYEVKGDVMNAILEVVYTILDAWQRYICFRFVQLFQGALKSNFGNGYIERRRRWSQKIDFLDGSVFLIMSRNRPLRLFSPDFNLYLTLNNSDQPPFCTLPLSRYS
jgi:hypothetical protein